MILEGFIQGTSDEELLKSLPTENISEDLVKAMNKVGLVQKEVQVKGKNGQTFTRKQWVKASDVQSTEPVSQSKQAASKDNTVDDETTKSYSGDEAVDKVCNLKSGSVIEITTKLKDGSTITGEYTLQTKKYALGTSEAWVKTGGNHYQYDFAPNKTTVKSIIGSTRDSVKIKKAAGEQIQSTQAKDKKNSTKKPTTFTGKNKDELWSNLKSAGYEVDGADKQTPQDKITLYKDKQEFTATFNKYNDGGVEVLNIKPVQTPTTVNKKPSQSYTNTGELLYNGQTISKVARHGTYMYKIRGVKDLFGSQKQAKEYVDKNLLDHNTGVHNQPKVSMLEDYFTGNHGHSDSKSALVALLDKGYSRQDIMSQAEKSGVTWKKNDHEGINWMRASMAIQKAWKKG